MAAGGHIVLRFSRLWSHTRIPGAELMLNIKFSANRTNRFEVIPIFGIRQFFVGGRLDFRKIALLTPNGVWVVLRRSTMPNMVKIGRTVRELFKFL